MVKRYVILQRQAFRKLRTSCILTLTQHERRQPIEAAHRPEVPSRPLRGDQLPIRVI